MPTRETISKIILFGVVTVVLGGSGVMVLGGNHAYNDYLNAAMGLLLVALALATAAVGVATLVGAAWEARLERADHEVTVTPRGGPPLPPPTWGMGNVGRPDHAPGAHIAGEPSGTPVGGRANPRGSVKVVHVTMRHIDAPIVLGLLLVWTAVAVMALAPH